jgi:hypothetical protein
MDFKKVAPEAIGVNGAAMPFELSLAGDIFEMGEKQDMHRLQGEWLLYGQQKLTRGNPQQTGVRTSKRQGPPTQQSRHRRRLRQWPLKVQPRA